MQKTNDETERESTMKEDGKVMKGDKAAEQSHGRERLAIQIDYEKYLHFLKDEDISEEAKRELLGLLWGIVCEFVAMGFGVHPVQQAQTSCGKLPKNCRKSAHGAGFAVDYEDGEIAKSIDMASESETTPAAKGVEE